MPYRIFDPFHIGPFMVNFYGVMFAIGTSVAYFLAIREARSRDLDDKLVDALFFYLIIGGIVGARIGYILLYWPKGLHLDIWEVFKIWKGGLAFYGGFAGSCITGIYFIKRHRMDFWRYADAFTIPLVVGHIFGRIGDYLTGGHPGKPTTLPWAIYLNGELRHPVVLYEILGLGIILSVLLIIRRKRLINEFLFVTYMALYAIQRVFLDIFRIERTDPRYLGLTPSQLIAIGILLLSIIIFYDKTKNSKT